jgi:hypothetical protein
MGRASPSRTAAAPLIIGFGANALGTTGTRLLFPWGSPNTASNSGVKRMATPFAMRAVRMVITNPTAGAGTGSYAYTFGTVASDVFVPTALTVSMLATGRKVAFAADVDVALDADLALQVVASGTISSSPIDTYVSIGCFLL